MKKVIIITIALLLCCCLTVTVFFGLFGRIEINQDCVFRGPLAGETQICRNSNENVDNTNNSNTDVEEENTGNTNNQNNEEEEEVDGSTLFYRGNGFSFSYPTEYYIDEDDLNNRTFLFKDSAMQGDNLLVSQTKLTGLEPLNSDFCDMYTEEFSAGLGASASVSNLTMTDSGLYSVNRYNACMVSYTAVISGSRVYQMQYLVLSSDLKTAYYLTVTTQKSSDVFSFDDVIDTFRLI